MLAAMFSGRHYVTLDRDKDGNAFFDYPASIMMPLIDYLRLHRDESPQTRQKLSGVSHIPIQHRDSFHAMLKFYGFSQLLMYQFSGVQRNVPIDALTGWTLIFREKYKHPTILSDFQPPPNLQGGSLLIAARRSGSDYCTLAAMGNAEVVTAETEGNGTQFHNGTYWYCRAMHSIGFSPSPEVNLLQADSMDPSNDERLSWSLSGCGGWRAGAAYSCLIQKIGRN